MDKVDELISKLKAYAVSKGDVPEHVIRDLLEDALEEARREGYDEGYDDGFGEYEWLS